MLKIKKEDDIAIATISRPEQLNILNSQLLQLLIDTIHQLEQEKTKAFILTGQGERSFIAGADLKEIFSLNEQEMIQFSTLGQKAAAALENSSMITMAAINGYALGGGLEMVLACDLAYALPSAQLGLPEVTLGLIPGFGGTVRLIKALGSKRAMDLIISCRCLCAGEALEWGIINGVVEPDQSLIDYCSKKIFGLLKSPAHAVIEAKKAIRRASNDRCIQTLYNEEAQAIAYCLQTDQTQKTIRSFFEKRGR